MKIQVIKATEVLVRQEGARYCGVEVEAEARCLKSLNANVDPQHGGGTFGFHHLPCLSRPSSAAYTAWFLKTQRAAEGLIDADTVFVTTRLDPDSLVAAMILGDEFSAEELEAMYDSVKRLSLLDTGTLHDMWLPKFVPRTVGDDAVFGPLAALCMQYPRVSLETLIQSARFVLLNQEIDAAAPAEYTTAARKHTESWTQAKALIPRFECPDYTPVAYGVDLPFVPGSGAFAAGYSLKPVVALSSTLPGMAEGRRKHIVAYTPGFSRSPMYLQAIREAIAPIETGWGGSESLFTCPREGSILTDAQFLGILRSAWAQVIK